MTSIIFLDAPGGGTIGLMPCPGRENTLEQDVAAIKTSGASLVISLIEAKEKPDTIVRLPLLLAAEGIAWRHWPIADFGIPDHAGEHTWPELSEKTHGILDHRHCVLVHCWGGRGRSGMMALRLLIERGEPAGPALDRLRQARPGAVETGPQLAWAEAGRLRIRPIADQISKI